MRLAKRVFDEGQALLRRNSSYLQQRQVPRASHQPASRVESSASSSFFSSSSIAKMLTNYDQYGSSSSSNNRTSRSTWKTRSTSSTSMKAGNRGNGQRRSSSGSGLSSTSSSGSSGGYRDRNHRPAELTSDRRASSSSSLSSFDDRYDHLYSYSSNLDLFEHQLFKQAATRKPNQPSNDNAVNDFDLTVETKLLMDRTNQLVGKKSDREWVI